MTEILLVNLDITVALDGEKIQFDKFDSLVKYLFKKGNNEHDTNHITVVVIEDTEGDLKSLNTLSYQDKLLLLKYFFNHLNLLVVSPEVLEGNLTEISSKISHVNEILINRINRVEIWTGTGPNSLNDYYSLTKNYINDIISTMSFIVNNNSTKSAATVEKLTTLKNLIIDEINFLSLLSNHSPQHLTKLTWLLGHWSFPAHELSNDDLVYCVYLMILYSLLQIKTSETLYFPNSNELLGFIFMVRDTYRNGNPFHNFRHAVDVLQACFHFLVKLTCLKPFKQLQSDPNVCALAYVNKPDSEFNDHDTELIELISKEPKSIFDDDEPKYLNPLQTLGLLVAALGHDVGHPGVTNAFMIKYSSPTSLIYSERSVLESYHSSVFINKVILINWPSLLTEFSEKNQSLSIKELIISSILATDMAEHFEYIERLQNLKTEHFKHEAKRVKLISSLLIKCADISNVTRPLRVSAQWALVLAREFEEVNILEQRLNKKEPNLDVSQDLVYTKVPAQLSDVLDMNKMLHKGQIFFIGTFAENLFNNIAEFLPELNYTCEIIKKNKQYWLDRDQ